MVTPLPPIELAYEVDAAAGRLDEVPKPAWTEVLAAFDGLDGKTSTFLMLSDTDGVNGQIEVPTGGAESGERRNTHEIGDLRWVVEDGSRCMPSVRRSRG